jgi:hypothetical protein
MGERVADGLFVLGQHEAARRIETLALGQDLKFLRMADMDRIRKDLHQRHVLGRHEAPGHGFQASCSAVQEIALAASSA